VCRFLLLKMSLFVANISKNVRRGEIEDLFEEFGKCTIRPNVSAFT
jgi:RNA recognition motif-containing protein